MPMGGLFPGAEKENRKAPAYSEKEQKRATVTHITPYPGIRRGRRKFPGAEKEKGRGPP